MMSAKNIADSSNLTVFGYVRARFLCQIELHSISCTKLYKKKVAQERMTCVQGTCTSFRYKITLSVCHPIKLGARK